jgi:hypothetical protein
MSVWWPDACEAQNWNKNDRALRLRIMSQALGREITSANDLNNREDVDRLKAYLTSLSDSLKGAREIDHPEDGRGRRLRATVLDQVACLALYPLDSPMGRRGAENYIRGIIRNKFNRAGAEPAQYDDLPFRAILESLSASPNYVRQSPCYQLKEIPSQLDQLVMTVANRLHNKKTGFRTQAGHTMHTMLTQAALRCPCTQCNPRKPVEAPSAEPVAASNQPF